MYSGSLLVCARMEVEHIEQRLNVELRKDPRRVQNRVRMLRIIRRCLERIPGHVVLRPANKNVSVEQ